VRSGDTLEVVTLHDTRGALTLARADDVDELAGLEGAVNRELLTERVGRGVGGADLSEVTTGRDARSLEVAREGLVDLAGVDRTGGDLDGRVAVHLRSADLGDDVRRELDHRDGDELAGLVPDLSHAELGAEETLGNLVVDVNHVDPQP